MASSGTQSSSFQGPETTASTVSPLKGWGTRDTVTPPCLGRSEDTVGTR